MSKNDSDATGTSISGGLLRISVGFNVNASMSPTVSAVVTGGAQITAGGTLTLDATSNQPLPPSSDGTFEPGHVDSTTNTITFHCNGTPCIHNAGTGDVVTYDNRGGSQISPELAGRSIGVIVTGTTTIQLGTVFDADGSDATGSVSSSKDYIDYGNRPHLLETGDIIIYSGNIPGLTSGNAYRVFKVDDNKFKLQDTTVSLGTVEVSGDCGTTGCIDNGGNRIVVTNSFRNGDFVTYHAPPAVVTFGSTMVDVDLNGNDGLFASCTRAVTGDNAGANNIFVAKDPAEDGCLDDSGLSTGDPVTYIASDPTRPIGGLFSGGTYYVIEPGAFTQRTLQLANPYPVAGKEHCYATGYNFFTHPECTMADGPDAGTDPDPIPVTILGLTPNKTDAAYLTVVHTLNRANDARISGLTSGNGYYVVGCGDGSAGAACSSFFKLASSPTGTAINLNNAGRTGGPHVFQREGRDLSSGATGNQTFVLDISAGSGTQQLVGIGGASGGGTSGNQIIEASASGAGGGLINVASASSSASTAVTISTTVHSNAQLTAGTLNVTTHAYVAAKSVSSNDGGGLIDIKDASATVSVSATNNVLINSNARLTSQGDLFVGAFSDLRPSVAASTNGGGLVTGSGGATTASADYTTKTTTAGILDAAGTLTVEAQHGGERVREGRSRRRWPRGIGERQGEDQDRRHQRDHPGRCDGRHAHGPRGEAERARRTADRAGERPLAAHCRRRRFHGGSLHRGARLDRGHARARHVDHRQRLDGDHERVPARERPVERSRSLPLPRRRHRRGGEGRLQHGRAGRREAERHDVLHDYDVGPDRSGQPALRPLRSRPERKRRLPRRHRRGSDGRCDGQPPDLLGGARRDARRAQPVGRDRRCRQRHEARQRHRPRRQRPRVRRRSVQQHPHGRPVDRRDTR